jgi:acyl-CoA synthetase (AMP-forming)/AMP-acid ligase II
MNHTSKLPEISLPNSDLASVVLTRAAELGDRPALIDAPSGRTFSFNELATQIRHFSTGLIDRGFSKGDVFAIFIPNTPEYAIAFLGVAAAGGINTTVNVLYSEQDLLHQLKDSGSRFLLTVPEFLDRALPAAKKSGIEEVFVLGEESNGATSFGTLLANAGDAPAVSINPERDLVALPYSSGTTGFSKGVMLTHANLIANMILSSHVNLIDENDAMIGVLPFFHIYGMVLILNLAIYRGALLVTMPRFDLLQYLEIVQKHKITQLNLVPPIILALAKHPEVDNFDFSSVKTIGSGAAPLGEDLEQACASRLGCQVYQGYGLTEVAGASHIFSAAKESPKPGSVGPVLPNTAAKIIDTETGEELGVDKRGEILVKGPHVMKGYLNNAEATASTLDADGWFHTGDIGYVDADGDFYVVDRVKELIKYKGYQVAPAELEALLLSHSAIADAAVIPSPNEDAGEIPKAFIVLQSPITGQEIIEWVASKVAPYKKIRSIEIVDEIPKAASGKILRRVLVEQERQKHSNN